MKKLKRRLSPKLAKHLGITPRDRTKACPGQNPIYLVTEAQDKKIQAYKKKHYKAPEKRYNRRLSESEANFLGIKHRTGHQYKGNMQQDLKAEQVKALEDYRKKNKAPRKLPIEETETYKKALVKTLDRRYKTFVITWANNKTPVHDNFLCGFLGYASKRNAKPLVIPGRYKNPTSIWSEKVNEYWAKEVTPYLYANKECIHPFLEILGDLKIQPTSSNPLQGLKSITEFKSTIIGHPRNHFEFLPVLDDYAKKILTCTGACTVPNYTDSGAGYKGKFHHTLGFVVVELEGDHFHIRQVTADKCGNFYDIDLAWQKGKLVENKKGCEVFNLGDVHVDSLDYEVEEATFKLIKKITPKYVVAHDVFDGGSLKHWNTIYQDMILMRNEGFRVDKEIERTFDWIEKRGVGKPYTMIIPAANHNDWLDRWLENNSLKQVLDKRTFVDYSAKKAQLMEKYGIKYKGLFAHMVDEHFKGKVITLGRNDSFLVNGVEHSLHYDQGANGSRGSKNQFKNLNVKTTGGHSHSSFRKDGAMAAGAMTKKKSYEKGLGSKSISHVIQWYDGKRQAIHYVNGKFKR